MKNPPLERSFHCAADCEKSDEKASQIPRVHDKTLAKSCVGVFKGETNCSSAVEQLPSSFFIESIRGGFLHFVENTMSCHGNSQRLNSAPWLRRSRSIEGNEPSSNFEHPPRRVWTDFKNKDILVLSRARPFQRYLDCKNSFRNNDVVPLFDAHVPGTDISVRSPLKG